MNTEATEIYLKYWKPVGVTCTTNLADSSNIIHAGKFHLFPQRVFPVGRLDKDSSGLIILTSDGSIVNYLLDPKKRRAKEYIVTFRRRPTDDEIKLLSTGVVITTLSQRENSKPVTAKTLPCQVRRDPSSDRYVLGVYSRFIISCFNHWLDHSFQLFHINICFSQICDNDIVRRSQPADPKND